MTRRELLALVAASGLRANEAPTAPVAVAKCAAYSDDLTETFSTMFDQLGGLERLVRGKTVTIKLNLTGPPSSKFQGKPLGVTHYTHPKVAGTVAFLLGKAGATRIRFVESCAATAGPLEEYMLDSGWNVRSLASAATNVEFENTNALGKSKQYARFKSLAGGYMFPAFQLNQAFEETDVFVSLAKLKNHATCGVTLSMKNCFGNTPASIYGDDAGIDEPNESPTKGRGAVCHFGKRQPSSVAPPEVDPESSREPGYRMPRIVADLAGARPIDLAIIEGIETVAGGEGPWIKGLRIVQPGILIAGLNAVNTDAIATAIMGYDPLAERGTAPFQNCDNTLLLAQARGIGSADPKRIEVLGVPVDEALYPFEKA